MGWSHIYCIAAGGLLGSWITSVWHGEWRWCGLKEWDEPIRLADGWWLPKVTNPPPPPFPPSPATRPGECQFR